MPEVPYSGVQTVAPEKSQTPTRQLDVPASAMGGSIAAAVVNRGDTLRKVGDELFDRAYAMQQMSEAADADRAASQYVVDTADAFAEYKTKTGKAAMDGLMPFKEAVSEARAKMRESLSSPFAQRAFDQETRRTQGFLITNAASHAASQNRQYSDNAALARENAADLTAAAMPEDDEAVKDAMVTKRDAIRHRLRDQAPEVVEVAVRQGLSKTKATQINAIANNNSDEAQKLFDEAKANGVLVGPDIEATEKYIKKEWLDTSTRVESARIMAGNGADGKPMVEGSRAEMTARVDKRAQELRPGDELYKETLYTRASTIYNRHQAEKREVAFQTRGTVSNFMVNAREGGKLPSSIEEMPSDVLEAYKKLSSQEREVILRRMDANAGKGYVLTSETRGDWLKWFGMGHAQDKDAASVEAFINEDFLAKPWPADKVKDMITLQEKVYRRSEKNPAVAAAMGIIKDQLMGEGIKPGTPNWYKVQGVLTEYMLQRKSDKDPLADAAEIRKVGSAMIRELKPWGILSPSSWGSQPAYRIPVPKEDRQVVIDDLKRQNIEPSEDNIQKTYAADMLRKHFQKQQTPK